MNARALSSLIGGRHAVTYDTFWLVSQTPQAKTSNKIRVVERFAVECKYRTNPSVSQKSGKPVISWAKPYQIENYKKFSQKRRMPVFVVIGLGGRPDSPDVMYCLPLQEAKYPELFFSLLNNYEKDPESTFFWRNGFLT
jgi:hypothetical protein